MRRSIVQVAGGGMLCLAGFMTCEAPAKSQCSGIPDWPGQPALQEPADFQTVTDQAWTALEPPGWSYLRRTSSKQDDICEDTSVDGSGSAPRALRIIFTPDMAPNTEPSVHWIGLRLAPAVYAAWWVQLSPNWTPSPAGGGKIAFLHTPTGQVYTGFFGSSAPHHVSVNTEWTPYGQKIWDPNVTLTPITYGRWYRIEWYMRWESLPGASDGVIRWWVNGTLNGDYRSVRFPIGGFSQFEFAPTLQKPPPEEQYMYVSHTYVSVPAEAPQASAPNGRRAP